MNKIILVCSAAVGVSLYFLYALFAGIFLERLVLSTVTVVELVVVAAQLIKVAGVAAHYRTRPPRLEVLLWLFSLEIIVVIAILVTYLVTSRPFLADLFSTIFFTWAAGIALALPPYLIFASVVQMMRSQDPFQLILSPALIFAFVAFAASSQLAFANSFSFANFLSFLLQYANIDLSAGTIPTFSTLYLLVPSVVVFCSLVVRITVPTATSATPSRVSFLLPLLGAAVGLGWVSAGARFVPNTLVSFTLPAVIMVAALYAYIRR